MSSSTCITLFKLQGAVNDFRIEDNELSISFKGPGYAADVLVDRATGRYELTETRMGWIAVLNDLHKGRDAGKGWARLIDVSAVLMTVVSITGTPANFLFAKETAVRSARPGRRGNSVLSGLPNFGSVSTGLAAVVSSLRLRETGHTQKGCCAASRPRSVFSG